MNVRGKITPVILCGGSGNRLWPLSTPDFPKPFTSLVSDKSNFQHVLGLVDSDLFSQPIIVCNQKHIAIIEQQLGRIEAHIIAETASRNTCASIALASLSVDDSWLLAIPADIFISSKNDFITDIESVFNNTERDNIAVFGVHPTSANTNYGYIENGDKIADGVYSVSNFHEKPDIEKAKEYVDKGLLWNSGMFLFCNDYMNKLLAEYQPEIYDICRCSLDVDTLTISPAFNNCPAISFDYAIMEKNPKTIVKHCNFVWHDLGTWANVSDFFALANSDSQPFKYGDDFLHLTKDTLYFSELPIIKNYRGDRIYVGYYNSPIGILQIEQTLQHIISIDFLEEPTPNNIPVHTHIQSTFNQMDEYFAGKRKEFNLSVKLSGTQFQSKVWKELANIPYGTTASYGKIASNIRKPKAVRAVGNANNRNAIPIIIPCHRVIGSSGKMVGYEGGLWRKEWLLKHERCHK